MKKEKNIIYFQVKHRFDLWFFILMYWEENKDIFINLSEIVIIFWNFHKELIHILFFNYLALLKADNCLNLSDLMILTLYFINCENVANKKYPS